MEYRKLTNKTGVRLIILIKTNGIQEIDKQNWSEINNFDQNKTGYLRTHSYINSVLFDNIIII